jgi:HicB_like antitoxin of bacterial toxin-antitoxin system
MAKEAIELHLGNGFNRRKHVAGTATRLNITVPERVADAVDRFAAKYGETRPGLLERAVSAYIGREENETLKPGRQGRPSERKRRA